MLSARYFGLMFESAGLISSIFVMVGLGVNDAQIRIHEILFSILHGQSVEGKISNINAFEPSEVIAVAYRSSNVNN